ncbi:sodium-dependent transporter [Arcobacter sp. CECT 8985]|uniref:sodium-dependent transporter n=1 Tax=Arcobacter sp. CECT 8985 TaxID=1935424 RepID=UPI00100B286B|nr:sodium-dependent transporter [Arcobacter sp. CECT 8985]RXJ86737.1 sodium-dependent transporter [Arcobacter sp. CECT 8985]
MNHFSRIGFILAAAGSAVGLGNIWKFPYITGEYGGGAFVLVYLLAIVFIGLSVFLAEAVIGQNAQADIATAFIKTSKSKNKNWKFTGLVVIAGLLILSFYSVVLGWILNYIFTSFGDLPTTPEVAEKAFGDLLGKNIVGQIIFHTIIAGTVIFIVLKGIKAGIERINLILMPLLAIILIGLLIYALTLDSFSQAVTFMFYPDWSKIDGDALLAALGQAFFTLSLGVGTILTYSASLPRRVNFVKSSIMVAIVDTTIAIVAGLIIFSFLFEAGAKSTDGPGLVFISLPVIFSGWGVLGHFISLAFFIALVFAGITSAVSMIEPSLKFFTDRFGMTRTKATVICGTFFYVFGIIALLSMTGEFKPMLTAFGKNAFNWMDFVTSSVMMPLAAILTCVFLGYFVDKDLLHRIFTAHVSETFFNIWYFLIKFLVPIAITILLLNKLGVLGYFKYI